MKLFFASCQIDVGAQELRRDDKLVHLEPQVFDLLLHLVRNHDRVVGKDELLEVVWNGRIVSEAALSSRINAARKAVGDDGSGQRLIRTIHRRGFRFVGTVSEAAAVSVGQGLLVAERDVMGEMIAGAAEALPPPAPDHPSRKPSVAVLPFASPGAQQEADYFSYGLTEDVIRLLGRNRWLDVLSRHSALAFRSPEVDPREIGAALGIRYLVQGTVLREQDRARISANLISAETGRHLWGESYDFVLADLLDVQKAMAEHIAAAIEPELARTEREAAVRRPPTDMQAWDFYQQGLWHLWGFTTPGFAEGEEMFRKAIHLDPNFARAHGALAYVKLQRLLARAPAERTAMLDDALRDGLTAVGLDDQDCMNLCVVGRVLCCQHEYDEAIAYLEDSIAVNPSFAQAYFALGFTLIACARAREALPHLERAQALSPRDPHLSAFYHAHALARIALGEPDAALPFARRAARIPNAMHYIVATLACVLGLLDRPEEAARAIRDVLALRPEYTQASARAELFFCSDTALVERILEGLRRAGLPAGQASSVPAGRGRRAAQSATGRAIV